MTTDEVESIGYVSDKDRVIARVLLKEICIRWNTYSDGNKGLLIALGETGYIRSGLDLLVELGLIEGTDLMSTGYTYYLPTNMGLEVARLMRRKREV